MPYYSDDGAGGGTALSEELDLSEVLHRFWGFRSFRPLQEQVVRSLLAGKDVAAIMPTGGGKSLCYQLPAVLLDEYTAIVISPLIALMQDQVYHLERMGISAAALNSTVTIAEQNQIMQAAREGQYRLLYLSPERLARPDTIAWLQQVPVSFFVVDEAHCISEWGHEFRPDYRQLSTLRQHFPEHAIAAFTASATQRVRHDIVHQLDLREPDKYIRSFHRPNLRYLARRCAADTQASYLLAALQAQQGHPVIVYAPTIARVQETVELLQSRSISAVPYHGQMNAADRQRNQRLWMSDQVPVLVGTLAFGLGIHKPDVRAVIHLALPKSIEQYYQEAGRAGRDGEPADCVLLWQKRDLGLLAHFIEQLQDVAERERAWARYHEIRDYAEGSDCRHHRVCRHFGETPKWTACAHCDACGNSPAWLRNSELVDTPQPARRARPIPPQRTLKLTPAEETIALLQQGRTLPEVAQIRSRTLGTVTGMVADLVAQGRVPFQESWVDPAREQQIAAAIAEAGAERLKPIKDLLPAEVTFEEIRLVIGKLRHERRVAS